MSAEFDDVLTNQPVVIDNVSVSFVSRIELNINQTCPFWSLGIWDYKGRLCWSRPSEMLLPIIVNYGLEGTCLSIY
jgi:hypothetical protein